jgi:hypothetical protein
MPSATEEDAASGKVRLRIWIGIEGASGVGTIWIFGESVEMGIWEWQEGGLTNGGEVEGVASGRWIEGVWVWVGCGREV